MDKNLEKIFSEMDCPEHSGTLQLRILSRIEKEKKLAAIRKKIFILSFSFAASFLLLIFSWVNFNNAAAESGLFQLFSLIFTDFSSMALDYYQDFLISLVESLPIISTVGLIAGVLLLVESSVSLVRSALAIQRLG